MKVKEPVINIDSNQAQKSVKELRAELKKLKDELLNVEQGTDDYRKALQMAGDIQHELREQMQEISAAALDFGQIVGNVTKSLSGISAGFQTVQAAMSLMGVESEEVTKAIQKMQAMMALTQGLAGIDDGIKAITRLSRVAKNATGPMKALGVALTPKVLIPITIAITGLVAVLGKFKEKADRAKEAAENLAKAESERNIKKQEAEQKAYNDELERTRNLAMDLAEIRGASKSDILQLQVNYKEADVVKTKQDIQDISGQIKKNQDEMRTYTKEIYERTGKMASSEDSYIKARQETIKQLTQQKSEANTLLAQQEEDLNKLNKSLEDQKVIEKAITDEKNKQAAADAIAAKNSVDNQRRLLEQQAALREAQEADGWKYTEEGKKYYDDFYNKLFELYTKDSYEYNAVLIQKLNYDKAYIKAKNDLNGQDTEENEYEEVKAWVEKMLGLFERKKEFENQFLTESELAQKELADKRIADSALLDELEKNNIITHKENLDKKKLLDEKYAEDSKKIEMNRIMFMVQQESMYVDAIGRTFSAVGQMIGDINEDQEEGSEKALETQKAFEISGVVISTLAGIASATASIWNPINSEITLWGQIAMQVAVTAEMLASMTASIIQIKNQKLGSSGSVGGLGGVSGGAVASLSAPVSYTQDIAGANIEESIKNQRVYVVSSDIDEVHNQIAVTESEATF